MHLCKGAVTAWQGAMYLHPAIFLWVQSVAPSKTAGMPKRAGQIPRSFLLPETVFTKEPTTERRPRRGRSRRPLAAAVQA